MKKLFVLSLLLYLPFTGNVFADEPTIAKDGESVMTTLNDTITEIPQEKIQYNYYYSPTCHWCQKLNTFLDAHDGFQKLNINKIDVRTRGDEMVHAAEEHGIDGSSVGTPFVTYGPNGTGSAIENGYYGALALFADALGVDAEVPTQNNKDSNRLFIIIFGLLIIIGPLAYLGLKK